MAKLELSDLPEDLDEFLNLLESGCVDYSDLPPEAQEFVCLAALLSLLLISDSTDNTDLPAV